MRPKGELTLYTDFRYAESAIAVPGVQVEITKRAMMAEVGARLRGRLQFEADVLPYLEWERLSAGKATLVPTHGIVDGVRAVKDEEEVAKLRRAARVADRALEALTSEIWIGRTERELAWRLQELVHAHGGDGLAFDSIVASGPNGALPHAHPTDAQCDEASTYAYEFKNASTGQLEAYNPESPPARRGWPARSPLRSSNAAVCRLRLWRRSRCRRT